MQPTLASPPLLLTLVSHYIPLTGLSSLASACRAYRALLHADTEMWMNALDVEFPGIVAMLKQRQEWSTAWSHLRDRCISFCQLMRAYIATYNISFSPCGVSGLAEGDFAYGKVIHKANWESPREEHLFHRQNEAIAHFLHFHPANGYVYVRRDSYYENSDSYGADWKHSQYYADLASLIAHMKATEPMIYVAQLGFCSRQEIYKLVLDLGVPDKLPLSLMHALAWQCRNKEVYIRMVARHPRFLIKWHHLPSEEMRMRLRWTRCSAWMNTLWLEGLLGRLSGICGHPRSGFYAMTFADSKEPVPEDLTLLPSPAHVVFSFGCEVCAEHRHKDAALSREKQKNKAADQSRGRGRGGKGRGRGV